MTASVPSPRCVLYLRMSSDQQTESIPSQRAELKKLAQQKGYQIVREYVDSGISGDDTERRSSFLKMRDDAPKREFDRILCWDQDRFGRFDVLEAGHWLMPFRAAGIVLETIAQGQVDWENSIGRITYAVMQEAKNAFLKDLSRNVSRGFTARFQKGEPVYKHDCYGYRKIDSRTLEIAEDQAEVVRQIFNWYLSEDIGMRTLAKRLNAQGVPSPQGTQWQAFTVAHILGRQVYVGDFVFGLRPTGKYHRIVDGNSVQVNGTVPEAKPTIIPDSHPAIIDRKTFEATQKKLAKRTRMRGPVNPEGNKRYLFSSLLRCGLCGSPMAGVSRRGYIGYQCSGYTALGNTACECNQIRENVVLCILGRAIRDNLSSDTAIAKLKKRMLEMRTEAVKPISKRQEASLRKRLSDVDGKLSRALDRMLELPDSAAKAMNTKIAELGQQKEELERQLRASTTQEARSRQDIEAEVERAAEAIRRLPELIENAPRPAVRKLVVELVEKITLNFERMGPHNRRKNRFKNAVITLAPDSSNLLDVPSIGR